MKPLIILLLCILFSGCSVTYVESSFSVDQEFGYDVTVLTPEGELIGDFVYLTDSNTSLSLPTELMKKKLNEHYRILIPIPWGNPGRSSATLDNVSNRLRGVSYSLEKLREQTDSNYTLEILAEGFYTPVALRVARNFRAEELILVQPIANHLQQELIWQFQDNRDTSASSLISIWNIENDSARTLFTEVLNNKTQSTDRFFGIHYSNFIRSYWTETETLENLREVKKNTRVQVLISPFHPLYSKFNQQEWENRIDPLIPWDEKRKFYSIENMEKAILAQ